MDGEAITADAAYRFFQSHSSICAGLLEDPKGTGCQYVFSAAGESLWLQESADAPLFFSNWKDELAKAEKINFPTLKDVFYLAYEAGRLFERLPTPRSVPVGGLIWRLKPEWSICFDQQAGIIYLSSTRSEAELDRLVAMLGHVENSELATEFAQNDARVINSDYQAAVNRVREYIQQGDIFQANIARFWQMACDKEQLLPIYAKLRRVNPAPFASFLKAGELTILSASPERLFSIDQQGTLSARPIAGTRKRSDGDMDDNLAAELLLSEKERAEHIMLVDLVRNDLGRVCLPGSIEVDECMIIEKYATVQHIVSNIIGRLDSKFDLIDVLASLFPGGTITGCPKVRCMEIIHEIEPQARGPYTGGIGYVAFDGSVDMNILIRTFWHWQQQLCWAAGAGIVADSIAVDEEIETEHKVAGLLRVFS